MSGANGAIGGVTDGIPGGKLLGTCREVRV